MSADYRHYMLFASTPLLFHVKQASFCRLLGHLLRDTHTHTTILLLFWNMSRTTRVSRYQKGKTRKVKTNLDLLEQEIVSGSGICWAICKSAPQRRQPRQHPTTQFFTGRMPFLPPNQQRQSTEGQRWPNKPVKCPSVRTSVRTYVRPQSNSMQPQTK